MCCSCEGVHCGSQPVGQLLSHNDDCGSIIDCSKSEAMHVQKGNGMQFFLSSHAIVVSIAEGALFHLYQCQDVASARISSGPEGQGADTCLITHKIEKEMADTY